MSADNVVQLLTHDQYEGLVDLPTGPQAKAEEGREDQLGSLAQAALNALENESLDLKSLSNAMTIGHPGPAPPHVVGAARGRGGLGAGRGGGAAVAGLDDGGGDQPGGEQARPVPVGATPTWPCTPRASSTMGTLTVHLQNNTPPGQSQFIAGPYPGLGTVYGEYLGVLAVNLPGYASVPHIDGNPTLDALGGRGPHLGHRHPGRREGGRIPAVRHPLHPAAVTRARSAWSPRPA